MVRRERGRRFGSTERVPRAGFLVGGRYRLRSSLGSGGYSEVWKADDRLGGGVVAVKLLYPVEGSASARIRSEISILRLHRLPGIVQLLDEGADDDPPFIVMELVRGEPFPGKDRFRSWAAISETTVALVETLARLHLEGVIHCDIKPENVLVGPDGKPTLLDFGIASDRRLDDLDDGEDLIGTVPYIAPERLLRQPATSQVDLYSLGVILFEALTGELPHSASTTRELLWACAHDPAPPVRRLAPETPHAVAGLVDLLLSKDPTRRPRSALEVLGILRGHPTAHAPSPLLRRLDDGAPVMELLAAVRAGHPADLVGPRRSGRSRCLAEAKSALERDGRNVVLLQPSRRPLSSLAPAVVVAADIAGLPVDAVVDARLRKVLAGGLVVLADDVDRMDERSRGALARCREAGVVVRAFREAPRELDEGTGTIVRLSPLDEAALSSLFAGPERLFHLRSDAARILHARTNGLQARVAEEIHIWLRAKMVRWNGEHLVVDRDVLDRLAARLPVPLLESASTHLPRGALAPRLEELLAWISLAWPSCTPEILAACLGRSARQIMTDVEELTARGFARYRRDGSLEPAPAASRDAWWPPERQRAAHRTLARVLPRGAAGRFFHLVAAREEDDEGDSLALADEAVHQARRMASEGRFGEASTILREALIHVRHGAATAPLTPQLRDAQERLLATYLDLALADGTAPIVGRVHYEIARNREQNGFVAQLDALARAALAYPAGGDRALRMLDAMSPFEDLDLERRRQGLRARAARRCPPKVEDATLAEVAAWASHAGDPVTRARLGHWLGWWRYRRGRFAEAARLHVEAAEGDPWLSGRVSARIAAASALMETFAHEEAARLADKALREARSTGSPHIEARAEWIHRAVMYRCAAVSPPDLELVDAVSHLGARDIEAIVCFTEAAFAYRSDEHERAAALARHASNLWKFVHDPWPNTLARCLLLAAGGAAASAREAADLGRRARSCPVPGLGIQALGLLARASEHPPREWARAAPALARTVPRQFWHLRMDVLSVAEAVEALEPPKAGMAASRPLREPARSR